MMFSTYILIFHELTIPFNSFPSFSFQFSCDGPHCESTGPIVNVGTNRFNCFICDFDLCRRCAERSCGYGGPQPAFTPAHNLGFQAPHMAEAVGLVPMSPPVAAFAPQGAGVPPPQSAWSAEPQKDETRFSQPPAYEAAVKQ